MWAFATKRRCQMAYLGQGVLAELTNPSPGISRPQICKTDLRAQASAGIGLEPLQEIRGYLLELL
jgi:hypothetical protein